MEVEFWFDVLGAAAIEGIIFGANTAIGFYLVQKIRS